MLAIVHSSEYWKRDMTEYTSAEVAAQLHVSQEWIWQCVRDGRLAARRIGGKRMLLIAEADLIAFARRYNKPLPEQQEHEQA